MAIRGIREVPMGMNQELREFLVDVRESILSLRTRQAPLNAPTNLRITPLAFANLLQWTRTVNADYYEVLWNTVSSLKGANIQGVGDSASWVDQVGNANITRFYWLRARKYNGSSSGVVGPVTGKTLASGTGVTPPAPPPPSTILVIDQTSGHQIYYVPIGAPGGGHNIKVSED